MSSEDGITQQDYEQQNKNGKRDKMFYRRKMVYADRNFCYKIVPAFFFSSVMLLWTLYFILIHNITNANDFVRICEMIIEGAKFLSETLIITIFIEKCLYMFMANKFDSVAITKEGFSATINNQEKN